MAVNLVGLVGSSVRRLANLKLGSDVLVGGWIMNKEERSIVFQSNTTATTHQLPHTPMSQRALACGTIAHMACKRNTRVLTTLANACNAVTASLATVR